MSVGNLNDTIAAIATPLGTGGIAVIRLSGNEAIAVTERFLRGRAVLSELDGNTCMHCEFVDNGELIDDVVVTLFRSPNSYTGEDVVEVSCHGGEYLTKRILHTLLNSETLTTCRLANPGEFTMRTFLNGKLSLTQAEAVAEVISAENADQLAVANAVKSGALNMAVEQLIEQILEVTALLTAWADFPDEMEDDVEEISTVNAKLSSIANKLAELKESNQDLVLQKEGVTLTIAGKPNVGKSSIMNLLTREETSIVTAIAGTTRDVVREQVRINGVLYKLNDTAGLRESTDPIEQIGVERARERIRSASVVLAVFDSSQMLTAEDTDLIELIKVSEHKNIICVLNKIDLKTEIDLNIIEKNFTDIIKISAKNSEVAYKTIINALPKTQANKYDAYIINERQYVSVTKAENAINKATNAPTDIMLTELENALKALNELSGKDTAEMIINKVFAAFCVGK